MKALIIMSVDWADEFQCEQFLIMDSIVEAEVLVNKMETFDDHLWFGTNEGFEAGELENAFNIKNISDEQAVFLQETFGNTSFGTGVLRNLL